jgi:hypothetical protein
VPSLLAVTGRILWTGKEEFTHWSAPLYFSLVILERKKSPTSSLSRIMKPGLFLIPDWQSEMGLSPIPRPMLLFWNGRWIRNGEDTLPSSIDSAIPCLLIENLPLHRSSTFYTWTSLTQPLRSPFTLDSAPR